MVEICLISSATYPYAIFNQEQGSYRTFKDFQPLLPSHSTRNIGRSGCVQLRPPQLEDRWRSSSMFPESHQSPRFISNTSGPVLDIQDTRSNSVLFGFGIAEQCTRHEKIFQFLKSATSKTEKELNFSLVSDLMGLHTSAIDVHPRPLSSLDDEFCLYEFGVKPSLIYPRREFYAKNPLLDFGGDLAAHSSKIMVHPDDQVLFTGTRAEVRDLHAVIEEFYLSKNSTKCSKQPMLVPHFTGLDDTGRQARLPGSSLKLQTVTVAPLKSPEKIRRKPSTKKTQGKKSSRERDLYKKNYLHACESLLTVILDKGRAKKTALLSLKKSGPELPTLLTQLSSGIAGTGLAVIFFIVSRVAGGRVPFCTTKLLNAGLGFGLVWLSWAVNRLRDTIFYINRSCSSKFGLKEEEEMMGKVDRSVREVLFRAATLMAVALLRFA
eukprot:TRINITY_DN21556_c0_g1_i1.p1 TRINITY_DN21556_c0_g1~~TRINITY_DN21556_c0_g1_i1.p1  ORF type:complete len:436 (-),score=48.73 TRINITY_DN21556_c0_g1_i1:135-1442(-)